MNRHGGQNVFPGHNQAEAPVETGETQCRNADASEPGVRKSPLVGHLRGYSTPDELRGPSRNISPDFGNLFTHIFRDPLEQLETISYLSHLDVIAFGKRTVPQQHEKLTGNPLTLRIHDQTHGTSGRR